MTKSDQLAAAAQRGRPEDAIKDIRVTSLADIGWTLRRW